MSTVVSLFSFADKSTSCFVVFDRVCQGVVKNGLKKALLGKAYPAFKPVVQTGRSYSCERKRDAMSRGPKALPGPWPVFLQGLCGRFRGPL